ncbi:response regulator transcription factor [Mycoplasmatota bacterium]|nr:response regulator transcription factor [Mycoplasmatota bacterium]
MVKIFLIEDDNKLEVLIKEHLIKYDYTVFTVNDFSEVIQEFEKIQPDLVLLDINLPYYDGFYLCRLLRKKTNIPIIIISALSSDIEQVMGIELGADDYLVKPFNLSLLLAKIKACLRRFQGSYVKQSIINVNGLCLDENTFKMMYENHSVELSKNEFKLMKCLLENKNTYVKRETLLEILWNDSTFVDENTLTVNVSRVKQKLKDITLEDVVKTKRAVGYQLSFGDDDETI